MKNTMLFAIATIMITLLISLIQIDQEMDDFLNQNEKITLSVPSDKITLSNPSDFTPSLAPSFDVSSNYGHYLVSDGGTTIASISSTTLTSNKSVSDDFKVSEGGTSWSCTNPKRCTNNRN
jgi:hypothetical protein